MDKAALVEQDVRDGRAFLDALRQAGIPVSAAMWLRLEDDVYKLYLATPMVQEQGPISTYEKMRRILNCMEENTNLTFDDLMAVNTTNHFVNDLNKFIHIDGKSAIRLGNIGINDLRINDVIVYGIDEIDTTKRKSEPARRKRREENT